MRRLVAVFILGLAVMLSACGSSSGTSSSVNGNWSASLANSGGTQVYSFTTTLTQTSNSTTNVSTTNNAVSGSNLVFTPSSCFVNGATETGYVVVTLSGSTTNIVSNSFQLLIIANSSGGGSSTVLTMNGTVTNTNSITGSWSLGGSVACSGSGNFTMTRS